MLEKRPVNSIQFIHSINQSGKQTNKFKIKLSDAQNFYRFQMSKEIFSR